MRRSWSAERRPILQYFGSCQGWYVRVLAQFYRTNCTAWRNGPQTIAASVTQWLDTNIDSEHHKHSWNLYLIWAAQWLGGNKYFPDAVVPSSLMQQPIVFDCAIERLFSQLLLWRHNRIIQCTVPLSRVGLPRLWKCCCTCEPHKSGSDLTGTYSGYRQQGQ